MPKFLSLATPALLRYGHFTPGHSTPSEVIGYGRMAPLLLLLYRHGTSGENRLFMMIRFFAPKLPTD